MRIDEVSGRDIGINYDGKQLTKELEEYYDLEGIDINKSISDKAAAVKEVRTLIRGIKLAYPSQALETRKAIDGLTKLLENVIKNDYTTTCGIKRQKKT